jgi:hypothetical protein
VQITTINGETLSADVAGHTWCPPFNDNTFGALQALPSHFSPRYSAYIKMFFDFISSVLKKLLKLVLLNPSAHAKCVSVGDPSEQVLLY